MKIAPDWLDVYDRLAKIYIRSGMFRNAINIYKKGGSIHKTNIDNNSYYKIKTYKINEIIKNITFFNIISFRYITILYNNHIKIPLFYF